MLELEPLKTIAFLADPDALGEEEESLYRQLLVAHNQGKIDLSIIAAGDDPKQNLHRLREIGERLLTDWFMSYVWDDQELNLDLRGVFTAYVKRNVLNDGENTPLNFKLIFEDEDNPSIDEKILSELWPANKIGFSAKRILDGFILGKTPKELSEKLVSENIGVEADGTISEATIRTHFNRYRKEIFSVPHSRKQLFGTIRNFVFESEVPFDVIFESIESNFPSYMEIRNNKFSDDGKRAFWSNVYDCIFTCPETYSPHKYQSEYDGYSPLLATTLILKHTLSNIKGAKEALETGRNFEFQPIAEKIKRYGSFDEEVLNLYKKKSSCHACKLKWPSKNMERFWISNMNYFSHYKVKNDVYFPIHFFMASYLSFIEDIEITIIWAWMNEGYKKGTLATNPDVVSLRAELRTVILIQENLKGLALKLLQDFQIFRRKSKGVSSGEVSFI